MVVNRTEGNAERLAERVRRPARCRWASSAAELAAADVVISCTGATGVVVTADQLAAARAGAERPLAIVDLALPHDVDPAVADLPGVTLIGLRRPGRRAARHRGRPRGRRRPPDRRPGDRAPSSPPAARPASPRPSSRCARWPPAWSTPRWSGCDRGSPTSTRPPAPRSSTPCAGSPTSCSTSRPSGSRSWPTRPARCPTPPRWPSCSRSTPTPSTPSPGRRDSR